MKHPADGYHLLRNSKTMSFNPFRGLYRQSSWKPVMFPRFPYSSHSLYCFPSIMALFTATNAVIPSLTSQLARASPLILRSVHQMNHFNNCSLPATQKRNLGIFEVVLQTAIGKAKDSLLYRCHSINDWTCRIS